MSENIIFIVSASLGIDKERKISFAEKLEYHTDNIRTTISDHEENPEKLSVTLEIETTDKDRAHFIAENELLRIANILSWEKSIPIKDFKVGAMHYSTKPGNMNAIGFVDTLHLSVNLSLGVTLNKQGVALLSDKFKTQSQIPEDVQIMWREAISEESKNMQFILYYRILEFVNGNTRKSADEYIKKVEPQVELRQGLRQKDVTIYTYLRDNVHAKTPSYPYQDIARFLPKLSALVRKAIENRFVHNV